MTTGYRALCSDFYINQKLSVKLDLPRNRETTLDLFERVRRQFPAMASFKRYRDELALESPLTEGPHRWLAIRAANIRSGVVNPETPETGYGLHRTVLEVAPYFLSISPLDVEFIELLYGFDIVAPGNQDSIVAEALLAGSPLAALLDVERAVPTDFQPLIGLIVASANLGAPLPGMESLAELNGLSAHTEVHFEVKTRSGQSAHADSNPRESPEGAEPISVYLTLRRYEPVGELKGLTAVFDELTELGEGIVESRVLPHLVRPIREAVGRGEG